MSFLFCPKCGPVTETHVIEREETLHVQGEAITLLNPLRRCDRCGESIFDRELDGGSIHRAYETYRERHGLAIEGTEGTEGTRGTQSGGAATPGGWMGG